MTQIVPVVWIQPFLRQSNRPPANPLESLCVSPLRESPPSVCVGSSKSLKSLMRQSASVLRESLPHTPSIPQGAF
jgi:hypothetical protein